MKTLTTLSLALFSSSAMAATCDTGIIINAAKNWGRQDSSVSSCTDTSHTLVYANSEAEKHVVTLNCIRKDESSVKKTVTMTFRVDGSDCIMTNGNIR